MTTLSLFSVLVILATWPDPVAGTANMSCGRLPPCPDKPNCVSSQSADRTHAIEPLQYEGTKEKAWRALVEAVASSKRARIVTDDGDHLHAEFTSAVFRFVDDVDFLCDRERKVIHVRSASRVGWSDLGVNRRRVEDLRIRFQQILKRGE